MRRVSQPIWHFTGADTTEDDGSWPKGLLLLVVKFSCNVRHKIRSSKVHWCLPIPFETEVQLHNLIQLLPNPGRGFHIPHHPKILLETLNISGPSRCFSGFLIWDTCWGSPFQSVPPKQGSKKMQRRVILSLLSANNSHLNSHPESLSTARQDLSLVLSVPRGGSCTYENELL